MAVEGGGAYRQSLIRKNKTKKDIAALRQRQKKDPLRWTTESNPNKGFSSFAKSALKQGYRTRYPTTSPGGEYYRQTATAFDRGANYNTLITPTDPVKRKMNLDTGRALEGLRGEGSIGYGPETIEKRLLTDEMLQFGDQFYNPPAEVSGETGTLIAQMIRENPRLAAESMLFETLAAPARVTGTGNLLSKFISSGKGGIRKGSAMAMNTEKELNRPATAMDIIDTASWLPGISVIKPFATAGKIAKAYPKAAGAAVGGGLAAYGLTGGAEDAEAFSGTKVLSLIKNNDPRAATAYMNKALLDSLRNAERRRRGPNAPDVSRKEIATELRGKPYGRAGKGTRELLNEWQSFSTKNPNWSSSGDEIIFGHITPRAKGGTEAKDNFIFMTRRTNDEMNNRGNLSVYEFVEDEIRRTGKKPKQILAEWDLSHYEGPLPK